MCLAPTTIGALLSAIGIAGMSRLNQANVLAMSGRAIEAAGDVDILMLDKTGTITLGNRQAHAFIPADGVSEEERSTLREFLESLIGPEKSPEEREKQEMEKTADKFLEEMQEGCDYAEDQAMFELTIQVIVNYNIITMWY